MDCWWSPSCQSSTRLVKFVDSETSTNLSVYHNHLHPPGILPLGFDESDRRSSVYSGWVIVRSTLMSLFRLCLRSRKMLSRRQVITLILSITLFTCQCVTRISSTWDCRRRLLVMKQLADVATRLARAAWLTRVPTRARGTHDRNVVAKEWIQCFMDLLVLFMVAVGQNWYYRIAFVRTLIARFWTVENYKTVL